MVLKGMKNKNKENYSDEELLRMLKDQMIERKLSKFKPIFISWVVSIVILILILTITPVANQYVSYLIYILAMYVMVIVPVGSIAYMVVKVIKRKLAR